MNVLMNEQINKRHEWEIKLHKSVFIKKWEVTIANMSQPDSVPTSASHNFDNKEERGSSP